MRFRTAIVPALLLIVSFSGSLSVPASEDPSDDRSHAEFSCADCHETSLDEDPSSSPTSQNARPCLVCHEKESGVMVEAGRSHPVEIEYRLFRRGSLRDPKTAASGLGGTVEEDLLVNGRIVCVSCHDPHKTDDGLLVMEETSLCIACHAI